MTAAACDPIALIEKYYPGPSPTRQILIEHSEMVTAKALALARKVPALGPDLVFIREAGMLHDIGIFLTHAPRIGCMGEQPYVCHGVLGRELLEAEGLPGHALVCERHVGFGLAAEDIRRTALPLPARDMLPLSIEEQIICFADKFYSKKPDRLREEKPLDIIVRSACKRGAGAVSRLSKWMEMFGLGQPDVAA